MLLFYDSMICISFFSRICVDPNSTFYLRIVHLVDLLHYKAMYFITRFIIYVLRFLCKIEVFHGLTNGFHYIVCITSLCVSAS